VLGASGRRIIQAIVAGESDASRLASLGGSRLHASLEDLARGLDGRITAHHRFMLGQHLRMIEELEAVVAAFDARIEAAMAPVRDAAERLTSIPGIGERAAEVILAEIGPDMSPFPTAGHLLSWAGLVPRLDESAGKRRSTRVKKGAPWLKPVLVQCAFAAAHAKATYLQAQFLRLKARRGPKKAAIAVAASILTAVYHLLRDRSYYADLGPDHFVRHDKAKAALRLVRRIKDLGYDVEIKAAA
jgi:transposase